MWWLILGFVLFVAIALIGLLVVALADVGDEPGAHRFKTKAASQDVRRL